MGKGYIETTVTTALGLLPVENVGVTITDNEGNLISFSNTDSNGKTLPVAVEAPDAEISLEVGTEIPFNTVNLLIKHPNYYTVFIKDIQIFDGIKTLQPVELLPLKSDSESGEQLIIITPQNLQEVK